MIIRREIGVSDLAETFQKCIPELVQGRLRSGFRIRRRSKLEAEIEKGVRMNEWIWSAW